MSLEYFYPFEEFVQHLEAMKQVNQWKETTIFGSLSRYRDPNSANSARIIEYFHDCYPESREGGQKSLCFMNIHEYIGTHFKIFKSKGFVSGNGQGMCEIDRVLFRAVHLVFTHRGLGKESREIHPKRVVDLATALKKLDLSVSPLRFW